MTTFVLQPCAPCPDVSSGYPGPIFAIAFCDTTQPAQILTLTTAP